jgi:lysophospholipase L1-like esterase
MSRASAAWAIAAGAAIAGLLLPAAASAQLRLLAFGDSITEGAGDDAARVEKGYPPRLEALLRGAGFDVRVENHGRGGERTPEALARVNSVLNRGGHSFLLMLGSNDISRQISMETTLFNLNEMARRAELRGIAPVHATVIPRVPWASVDADNKTNALFAQNLRRLADNAGRRLADPFEVFGALPDRFARYYVQERDDHVGHPNAQGYDVLASIFGDVLRDIDGVPPVVAGLFPADGSRGVPDNIDIQVDLIDFGAGIDLAATALVINGTPVAAPPQGTARRARLSATPPPGQPWRGVVRVGVRTRDLAVPAHAVERTLSTFAIAGTTFFPGDLDESGRVDGADLIALAHAFGARSGEVRYSRPADLNGDGIVDGNDLAILASNFGRTS